MNNITLAIADVKKAFQQLEFAIKLMCYCELDRLDRAAFDTDVILRLETENVRFPNGSFATYESVVQASQIQVSVSFGISAIALDAAYDATGLPKNLKLRSPVNDLRVLVFMVRNACAHNMAFPCWKVNGEDLRGLPLLERKKRLRLIIPRKSSCVGYVSCVNGGGERLFEVVRTNYLEGLVVKRKDGKYTARTRWFKVLNPRYSQRVGREELFEWKQRRGDQ